MLTIYWLFSELMAIFPFYSTSAFLSPLLTNFVKQFNTQSLVLLMGNLMGSDTIDPGCEIDSVLVSKVLFGKGP